MKNLSPLKDYILIFEDALSDDLCDSIVSEYEKSNEWNKSLLTDGTIDQTIRNLESIYISDPHVITRNEQVRRELDNLLFSSVESAIKKYVEKFPASIQQDSGYQLLRYKEGQFYAQHVDSFKEAHRTISCSFSLNDDYEGGEFSFFDRELNYKLKKGSVLMFPSNFLYPHEVTPVISGVRYSIATWFV